MNYLNRIKNELRNYWDLEEDDEKVIELTTYILSSKEEDLIIEIQNIAQNSQSGIDFIYMIFDDLDTCDKVGNLIGQNCTAIVPIVLKL